MRLFLGSKNEKLVDSLMEKGPLLSIVGALDKDPSTKSGFHWSSSKGADVQVTVGTMGQQRWSSTSSLRSASLANNEEVAGI